MTGDEFLSLTCWRGYNRRMLLVGILLALEKRSTKNVTRRSKAEVNVSSRFPSSLGNFSQKR